MLGLRRSLQLLTILGWLAACTDAGRQVGGITAAGSAGGDPTVNATEPDSATQDTTLDVVITGSNFDLGSAAQWAIGGIAASKVRTNSTRFVNSKRLIANITIAADADTVLYDVMVTTSTGKKGIGTELFAVKRKATDTPLTVVFRDAASEGILSDAQIRAGDPTYVDGVDSVGAAISGGGGYFGLDARSQTLRKLCMDFHGQPGAPYAIVCDDGYATTNVDDPNLLAMTVGTTATTRFGVVWVKDGYNWSLKFGKDCANNVLPDRRAVVTRIDAATWLIESPSTKAFLCGSGVKGHTAPFVGEFLMPVELTLRLK